MPVDVAVIAGTRPEAIKLARVVHALRERDLTVRIVGSGQHGDLLIDALASFGLQPDVDLKTMRENQPLPGLTARLVDALAESLASDRPRFALVQGDSTTAMAGALACFYLKIPCGHVEAGLRSGDAGQPWPEEMNRLLTDRLCTHHYPPTEGARRNLENEGTLSSGMLVTGQTGVDAALWMASVNGDGIPHELSVAWRNDGSRLVYATLHRRESFGAPLRCIAAALMTLVEERSDVNVILPAHPNPNVLHALSGFRGRHERFHILPPVSYPSSIWLMRQAAAIVTDSGGIQEEAPSFGVPVLVARAVTERPEGIAGGFLTIAGTTTESVSRHLRSVLDDAGLPERLRGRPNPYGDGRASQRIADDVARILRGLPR